jgi:hypothetical protein
MATIDGNAKPTLTKGYRDVNTGKYTGGNLVISDIAEFFGLPRSSSLDQICRAGAINKFAKRKPVEYGHSSNRHPQPLMGDEIKGNPDAVANGIVYGLTVGASPTNWNELHDLDFQYAGPSSCYRISDFDGYYHKATCPISGDCWLPKPNNVYVLSSTEDSNRFNITLRTESSDYEISASELFGLTDAQLRTMYPCVKIGDLVHCLKNVSKISGTVADYTQMWDTDNSSWYHQFCIDVSESGLTVGNSYPVTVFLTNSYITSVNDDLRTTWVDVSGEDRMQQSRAYVVPGLVGITAYMGAHSGSAYYWGGYADSCRLDSLNNEEATIVVSVRFRGHDGVTPPTENVNVTITVNSLTVTALGSQQTIYYSESAYSTYHQEIRPVYPSATFTLNVGLGVDSVDSANISVAEEGFSTAITVDVSVT